MRLHNRTASMPLDLRYAPNTDLQAANEAGFNNCPVNFVDPIDLNRLIEELSVTPAG